MRIVAWDIVFLFLVVSNFNPSTAIEQNVVASVDLRFLASLLPVTLGFFVSSTEAVGISTDCLTADVIFLLDGSGNIGQDKWGNMTKYVRDVILHFRNASNIHFGLVLFGTSDSANVKFNHIRHKPSAAYKVQHLEYPGGQTNIAAAFKLAHEKVMPTGRSAATKVVILITDGKPTREIAKTESEAQIVKNLGAHVLTVGITNSVDKAMLKRIASSDHDVLEVLHYQQLAGTVEKLVERACPITSSGDLCKRADVGLIVDSSRSISGGDWNYAKQFLEQVIRNVEKGHDVRFGLVDFSTTANVIFNFNQNQSVDQVVARMKSMPYYGGLTNIADGLETARTGLFNAKRNDAVGVAILLTDGKPNLKKNEVSVQAKHLKYKQVHIVPVGVTNDIDLQLLKQIANNPNQVITSPDFKSLSSQLNNVIGAACGPTRFCNQADVVFAVDSSGSIGDYNWHKLTSLLEDTIKTIDTDGNNVHFGLVEFSTNAKVIFDLKPRSLNEVLDDTKHMKYIGGLTDMRAAFDTARTQVFQNTSRTKSLIMITDGKPNNPHSSQTSADKLKDTGVRIITIGVTHGVDEKQLKQMASSEEDVFLSPSFTSLAHQTKKLMDALCNRGSMKPE